MRAHSLFVIRLLVPLNPFRTYFIQSRTMIDGRVMPSGRGGGGIQGFFCLRCAEKCVRLMCVWAHMIDFVGD